jgi:hypothetical protein
VSDIKKEQYLVANFIAYDETIKKIKKSSKLLAPIFEAFINSYEAIKLKREIKQDHKGFIRILIFLKTDLTTKDQKSHIFEKIIIEDDGIGFTDRDFERFKRLNDTSKKFFNKGTGRIQFIHFFNYTEIVSVYYDTQSSKYIKRNITLSKSDNFLRRNAIIRLDDECISDKTESYTKLVFKEPLDNETGFSELDEKIIKEKLINNYLSYFCENRDDLPEIEIIKIVDGKHELKEKIQKSDILKADKEISYKVNKWKYSTDLNSIYETDESENIKLKSFKFSQNELKENKLYITCKGEIVQTLDLDCLRKSDHVNNNRYLFFISSNVLDSSSADTRGDISLKTKTQLKQYYKETSMFDNESHIIIEDIQNNANYAILANYEDIKKYNEEKDHEIESLRKMFLLNEKTINELRTQHKFSVNDTEADILEKIYKADAAIVAKNDAKIKQQIQSLNDLNTTSENYNEELNEIRDDLVKEIPFQNRTGLAQYVVRRKLVLDLFDVILKKELMIQKEISSDSNRKNIDEKLLHNLIFKQSSEDPDQSDLWIMNEEYIYFNGVSEKIFKDISFCGNKIFKDVLTEEEDQYRLKQEGDADKKRPDILLFPSEGKCIIIEFKAPDVNVSDHLNQINRYASLINNLSKEEYKFTTYYGYLIGENIDVDDIKDNDADFRSAHSLNFIYRPYKRIIGKFEKSEGSLYTEIIKYSTLLERAKMRNEIFIKKLGIK